MSSCIIERKTLFLAQCDRHVFSWCGPLPLAFIGAPWGVLQGPLRSLGSQPVGFSPLTPVNLLHKFHPPFLPQANQQCCLCCFHLSLVSCCWLLSCSFAWRVKSKKDFNVLVEFNYFIIISISTFRKSDLTKSATSPPNETTKYGLCRCLTKQPTLVFF